MARNKKEKMVSEKEARKNLVVAWRNWKRVTGLQPLSIALIILLMQFLLLSHVTIWERIEYFIIAFILACVLVVAIGLFQKSMANIIEGKQK